MTEEEKCEEIAKLSYLGGIIDGEGHILIAKNRGKYRTRLRVVNTDRKLLDWLLESFKGNVYRAKTYKENHKDKYEWYLNGYKAYKLLKLVDSFLLLKREQAKIAEEFWYNCARVNERRRGIKKPLWMKVREEEYYQQMKKLNKRGK